MSANASAGVGVPHGGGVGAGLSHARPGTLAPRGRRVDAASVAKAAPSEGGLGLAVLLWALGLLLLAGVLWLPMAPGGAP